MKVDEAFVFAERYAGSRPKTMGPLQTWMQEAKFKVRESVGDVHEIREWAESWKKLCDNLDRIIAADPMLLYEPQNKMSREFHASPAFVRMICAGNRTSKTMSLLAEGAGLLTNRHWGRPKRPAPADIFHIGVDFQKYGPNVFEKKLIVGEPDTPCTPMFPVGGKWFHSYDERKKRLVVACPKCAEQGKAGSCRHTKSSWTLFSDNEGATVLQGGAYRYGIYDEEIGEEFWTEGYQRLQTVNDSFICVGFTPLLGPDHWPHTRIAERAKGPAAKNRMIEGKMDSQLFASYHTIKQEEAGLVPKEKVDAARATMDEAEAAARLDGEPVPIVEKPVFPRKILAEMRKVTAPPEWRGTLRVIEQSTNADGSGETTRLVIPDETDKFKDLGPEARFEVEGDDEGNFRVWQRPISGMYYIAAVDCAIGLASGDPVCMSILRVTPGLKGTRLQLDAQYHGWINSFDYAAEIMKIAIWYNGALVAIENTGGYGEAVALKLREFQYWNLFVDERDRTSTDPGQEARIGVSTNSSSKPFMVAAAQRCILERTIDIPCEDTIREMLAFEQARPKFGVTTRYRGASGTHDDRVMSLCIGCAVAASYPLFQFEVLKDIQESQKTDTLSPFWREILAERQEENWE